MQYKRILLPNLYTDCNLPIPFPTESIYHTPDAFDIPQGIYVLVKAIALDSVYCEVVMARSMMMRANDHGLKKGSLCGMKIYPKHQDSAERTRKSRHTKGLQQLRERTSLFFCLFFDASLQDESRYFLVMVSTLFSPPLCIAY